MRNLFFVLVLLMLLLVMPACQKTPADFHLESLQIAPPEVMAGQTININVAVSNVGGTPGTYNLNLSVDGTEARTMVVKVEPKKTETATFTVVEDKPGIHYVQVNNLSGTFRVLKFIVSNLVINPNMAKAGQIINFTADVTNAEEIDGNCSAVFLVNKQQIETKGLKLASGETKTVSFTFTANKTGYYSAEVGGLSGFFVVTDTSDALSEIKGAYPELYQELLKLPDLKEMDDKDKEAINNIVCLALNVRYKSAFESMLAEGIKDKRKYCAPLEALLWIAYDKQFDSNNPLEGYSISKLIYEGWKKTTTSDGFLSSRWKNFDEVINRLNSPKLILIYMSENFSYYYPGSGLWSAVTAYKTFNIKKGDCSNQSIFADYCLIKNGYKSCILSIIYRPDQSGHSVDLYKDNSSYYYLDNTIFKGIFGPFKSVKEAESDEITKLKMYGEPIENYTVSFSDYTWTLINFD